jgi:hypothetical protein
MLSNQRVGRSVAPFTFIRTQLTHPLTCTLSHTHTQDYYIMYKAQKKNATQKNVQATDCLTERVCLQLENEISQAAAANLAARAIKLEQRLEDEILEAAVRNLREPDAERRRQRMQQLGEMVKRDKRTVQAITGLLGASGTAAVSLSSHPQFH